MTIDTPRPDAAALVPHALDAVLLERVWQEDEHTTCATLRAGGPTPFADGAGDWPDWLAIEIMAQVVAASATLRDFRPGVRARLGLLLGVREFHFAGDYIPAGARLRVEVQEGMRDATGMGVFDALIEADGATLARATLSTYLPEDADAYLEGLGI